MKPRVELGIDPGGTSGHYAMLHNADGEWTVQITAFKNVTLAEFFNAKAEGRDRCQKKNISKLHL